MEKRILYKTTGTCSAFIELAGEDGRLSDVCFVGGCDGNLKGICSLVKGMPYAEVIEKLNGIRCGSKATSCPDQLCRAVEQLQAQAD